jgi:hypothetical protein
MSYFTLSVVNKKLKMCKVDPFKGHEEVKGKSTIVLLHFSCNAIENHCNF